MALIHINGRPIGDGAPAYIIAEVSANHNGSYEDAVQLIRAAHEAGVDAVKLQTYTPDTITIDSDLDCFKHEGHALWGDKSLYELYQEAYTPWEWQPKLMNEAKEIGITLFSAPFDHTAVEFLEGMNVPAYKISSFELVDLPLIRLCAQTGKPLIMSTGMASLSEVEEAVAAARSAGASEIALLKCTSAYPAPYDEMNLRAIPDLHKRFDTPVGLSDHTLGIEIPLAAVCLGASIIEKHITLSRGRPGPDSQFSTEPSEFAQLVQSVRHVEEAMGTASYEVTAKEGKSRKFRRSLFVVKDVKAGEIFTADNVRSIRPAAGLAPRHFEQILGLPAAVDVPRGTPLSWDHVAGSNT